MDGLSKLPPELLTTVFDELNPPDYKQIAKVSRYLSKCVQQHLYRSVTFTYESHKAQTTPPVLSFLRLMLSYPDRRKRVQNLSFLGGYYEEWQRFACTSFQRSHLEEGLSGTQFEKTGQLVDELKSGGERCLDAAIAFLLLSLTSLHTINIGVHLCPVSEAPYQSFVSGIVKHKIESANQTTPLPLLEEVSQCHLFSCKDERITAAIEVLWFFYIPNIKILRVSMEDGDRPLQWPRSFPTLTALHTLILQRSDINLGDLRAIMMTSVPNIRHFEYHFRCDVKSANRARHWLDCRTLREILELRADSLEHLALSIDFLYSAMPIEYDNDDDDAGQDEWSIAYGI
ncbi:MAG: hypothetical protein Q9188_007539, partial [Gyalolechia gomerana]